MTHHHPPTTTNHQAPAFQFLFQPYLAFTLLWFKEPWGNIYYAFLFKVRKLLKLWTEHQNLVLGDRGVEHHYVGDVCVQGADVQWCWVGWGELTLITALVITLITVWFIFQIFWSPQCISINLIRWHFKKVKQLYCILVNSKNLLMDQRQN